MNFSPFSFQVYNEDEGSLYIHHDIMLESVPLAIEWLSYDVASENQSGKYFPMTLLSIFDHRPPPPPQCLSLRLLLPFVEKSLFLKTSAKGFMKRLCTPPPPPIERPKIQLSLFDGSLKETFPFVNPAVVVYEEGRTDALKAERVRRKEWPNV